VLNCENKLFYTVITNLLPVGSAAGSFAAIVFTHVPVLAFFAPEGRRAAPIKVKVGREEGTYGYLPKPNFTLIGSGLGVYGPQN